MSTIAVGGALAKRLAEQGPPPFRLSNGFYWLLLVDIILFLPVLFLVSSVVNLSQMARTTDRMIPRLDTPFSTFTPPLPPSRTLCQHMRPSP